MSRLASDFTEAFVKGGGTISLVKGVSDEPLSDDFIKKLAQKPPPVIYLAMFPNDVPRVINQLRQNGIQSIIVGDDSYVGRGIIKQLRAPVNNLYFTAHAFLDTKSPNPVMRKFLQEYRKKYRTYPHSSMALLGYDTVKLIAAALDNATDFSADAFIKAMSQIQGFKGATGNISYVKGHRIPLKPVTIIRVVNGKPVLSAILTPTYVPDISP